MSYTKRPWKAVHRHAHGGENDDEIGGLGWDIEGPPEATNRGQFARAADARLIAAAPDLLEACEAMLEDLGVTVTQPFSSQGQAHNAIAKARGTQEGSDV